MPLAGPILGSLILLEFQGKGFTGSQSTALAMAIGNGVINKTTQPFTWEMWVNRTTAGGNGLMSQSDDTGGFTFFIGTNTLQFGSNGIDSVNSLMFVAIIVMLIFVGIGASSDSPMVMGIVLILGVIVLASLNILFVRSFVGVGATILWFIVAVIVLLVKGSNRT